VGKSVECQANGKFVGKVNGVPLRMGEMLGELTGYTEIEDGLFESNAAGESEGEEQVGNSDAGVLLGHKVGREVQIVGNFAEVTVGKNESIVGETVGDGVTGNIVGSIGKSVEPESDVGEAVDNTDSEVVGNADGKLVGLLVVKSAGKVEGKLVHVGNADGK
jgi:hypothetical protein